MWVALLQDYSYILASQKIWYLTISLPSDLQISLIGQNKKKKIIEQSAWQRGDEQKHSQPVAGVCRGLPKTCVYYGLYENGELLWQKSKMNPYKNGAKFWDPSFCKKVGKH